MGGPIELIPLVCFNCETAVPAQPEEVAWACSRCGQGLVLDETKGLDALEIHYHADLRPGAPGKPFWVVEGQVTLNRAVYGGQNQTQEALQFWATARCFFVPAYTCPLETLTSLGPQFLLKPPALQDGPAGGFDAVTLAPTDLQAMVEFIVMAVEASRKDKLRSMNIELRLNHPVLWILPGSTKG